MITYGLCNYLCGVILQQVAQLEVAVNVQAKAVSGAIKSIAAAERKRYEADKNLSKFVDQIEETEAAVLVQATLDNERSEKLAAKEVERAKRWENEQTLAMKTRAIQMNELTNLASKQIEVAKTNNKIAVKKTMETFAKTKAVMESISEHKDKIHEERTNAVLELKTNTAAVFDELKQSADKYRSKIKKNADELEAQKDTMLASGLNPYVEFRKREFDLEGKQRVKRMNAEVERNKSNLSETLLTEEDIARKEEIKERRERLYEKQYRDELGRHVVEERTRSYINEVTTDHVDILDPTGRAPRVDPSKITDVADFSFGLWKSARIPQENMIL